MRYVCSWGLYWSTTILGQLRFFVRSSCGIYTNWKSQMPRKRNLGLLDVAAQHIDLIVHHTY